MTETMLVNNANELPPLPKIIFNCDYQLSMKIDNLQKNIINEHN